MTGTNEPRERRKPAAAKVWTKGRGEPYPHEAASALLNPLRRLILTPGTLVRRLALAPGFAVLEIGPGPGYFSIEVARRIAPGWLFLYDIQSEMLEKAAARLTRAGLSNFETRAGDAGTLPYEDARFDVIFLVAVLGEVPQSQSCVRESHRVLKPGGLLSITEQPGDPDLVPKAEIVRMGEAEGFGLERVFGRWRNFTVNLRKPAA